MGRDEAAFNRKYLLPERCAVCGEALSTLRAEPGVALRALLTLKNMLEQPPVEQYCVGLILDQYVRSYGFWKYLGNHIRALEEPCLTGFVPALRPPYEVSHALLHGVLAVMDLYPLDRRLQGGGCEVVLQLYLSMEFQMRLEEKSAGVGEQAVVEKKVDQKTGGGLFGGWFGGGKAKAKEEDKQVVSGGEVENNEDHNNEDEELTPAAKSGAKRVRLYNDSLFEEVAETSPTLKKTRRYNQLALRGQYLKNITRIVSVARKRFSKSRAITMVYLFLHTNFEHFVRTNPTATLLEILTAFASDLDIVTRTVRILARNFELHPRIDAISSVHIYEGLEKQSPLVRIYREAFGYSGGLIPLGML